MVQDIEYMARLNCLRLMMALTALLTLSHCADYKQKKEWDSIDYSRVRNRDTYENDRNYRLPSVAGCTDDDLYNCK